uniref:NADH dehydrogenase subunit 5 n=1 Tax=Pediopsoides anchorides TaxID=3035251 RepID=UPI002410D785|nr:NADH dehydrogenase subunit 5 [Pediopsoides anchorides]WEP24778.1 NADH dehydrogenase subunit 5 [Pediopsoides anchorides]
MLKLNLYTFWFFFLLLFSMVFLYFSLYFLYTGFSFFVEWEFYNLNSVSLCYLIFFDKISMIFCFVVFFISSMVIIYSSIYMGINSYSSFRFLYLLLLFILSMIMMIISPNLVSILLGWDGLGIVSYCLVIYYQSNMSYLSGMITCLTNRLGDIGLLLMICWLFSYGGWHFILYTDFYNSMIFYIIIVSSFTSSAQVPFSCWLPAAMAAPTPVSALVHSSTLVTAGIYLLIRFYNIIYFINSYFLLISLLTMLISSFCANYEFDLSKIIAFSTLSQLGLMMSSLFMGLVDFSYFHLISHAMFKSLLFLCAGIYIFYMNDNQDIRFMGSICFFMPFTSSCFNISNFALCGIPFLSGFYSSDLIIDFSLLSNLNLMTFFLYYFCLGMTCMYSFRLFYYSMVFNIKIFPLYVTFDSFNCMSLSILILTFMSLFFGCLFMWVSNFVLNFLFLPFLLKLLSFIFLFIGFLFGYDMFNFPFFFNLNYYYFNSLIWFINFHSFYLYSFLYFFMNKSMVFLNWGEYYGAYGICFYLLKLSNFFQLYFFNNIKIFMLTFFFWFILMV